MASELAARLKEGLEELQSALGASFAFQIKEATDRGDVDVIINQWQSSQQDITVSGNGSIKTGSKEYKTSGDPAAFAAALKDITRAAMIAPTSTTQSPRRRSGPGF